jgi:predicted transposase/invertase (TIGR01784 family)
MLAQNSPQMQGPMEKLLEINQDPTARRLFEAREKERRDAVSRERRMKREGRQEEKIEIARNLLSRKMPINDIADITKLSIKEIEELRP